MSVSLPKYYGGCIYQLHRISDFTASITVTVSFVKLVWHYIVRIASYMGLHPDAESPFSNPAVDTCWSKEFMTFEDTSVNLFMCSGSGPVCLTLFSNCWLFESLSSICSYTVECQVHFSWAFFVFNFCIWILVTTCVAFLAYARSSYTENRYLTPLLLCNGFLQGVSVSVCACVPASERAWKWMLFTSLYSIVLPISVFLVLFGRFPRACCLYS